MDLDNKYWSDDIQKSGRLQNLVVIHSQWVPTRWEISSLRVLLDIPINVTIFQDLWDFLLDLRWPWTSICKSSSQPLLMHRLQWTVGNCIGALRRRVGQLGMFGIPTIFPQIFASGELKEGMPYASFPAGSKDGEDFDACAYSFGIGNASQVSSWVICTNLMHCATRCNRVPPFWGSFEEG